MSLRIWLLIVALVLPALPPAASAAAPDPAELIAAGLDATVRLVTPTTTSSGCIVERPGATPEAPRQRLLVTANHALAQSGEKCRLVLRQKGGDGQLQRLEIDLILVADGQPRWIGVPETDIGVARIELPENAAVKPIAYESIATADDLQRGRVRTGDDAWVVCYPIGLESSPLGYAVVRRGAVASYPLGPAAGGTTLMVDYKNFGGDSGSPVLASRRRVGDEAEAPQLLLLGLVIGQHRRSDRVVLPDEERVQHTSLGIGIVTQGQYVRQAIDRMPQ